MLLMGAISPAASLWLIILFLLIQRVVFPHFIPPLCFPRKMIEEQISTSHYLLMYFLCSVVHDSSKCFCFTTRKKKGSSSSLNVTCILLVGHFGFINECNNKSAGCGNESMGVFYLKHSRDCTMAVNASLSLRALLVQTCL